MTTRLLALLVCGALIALQVLVAPGQSRAAGLGTLTPSPAVIIALEEFRAIDLTGYFAVSEDGAVSGFTYCRRSEDCGPPAQQIAIKFCVEAGNGRPCRIFADANSLLWRGEVVMPQPDDLDLVRRGWRVFATTISWPEASPAARAG